jgi:hypothetical protein
MQDQHLDARALKRQLIQRRHVLAALSNFAALFRRVDEHLTGQGAYHRANRGAWSDGQDCLGFVKRVGLPRSNREVLETTQEIFNAVRDRALDLLEDRPEPAAREPKPLAWFMTPRALEGAD